MRPWWIGLLGILIISSCTSARQGRRFVGPSGGAAPDIRVLLGEGPRFTVRSSGGFTVQTARGVVMLESAQESSVTIVSRHPSLNFEITPGGNVGGIDGEALIVPTRDSQLSYEGTPYAGVMRVSIRGDGTVSLVNVLPLEAYLEGVVPFEIGDPGPDGFDAVKSQAIAARTYAYSKVLERSSETFDVHSGVLDQVYGGLGRSSRVAESAVRDTKGRVLEHGGKPIRAYYSACCGGHTSDIRLVWPQRQPADYLYGVHDRSRMGARAFCHRYKKFRWRFSFTGRELGDILRATIPIQLGVSEEDVGAVKDVRIERRSKSGRVIELRIETTKNSYTFEGDAIRWILMTDVAQRRILPSVMFRLEKTMERDRIAFLSIVGGGNGHGVGMCQNGAIGMARQGYTHEMILSHYYPGCRVTKMY